MKNSDAHRKAPPLWLYLGLGMLVVLGFYGAFTYWLTSESPFSIFSHPMGRDPSQDDHAFTKTGQFGDSYGALNALFSGLAFAALIVTLVLQRRELQATLEEIKNSVDAQKDLAETAKKELMESAKLRAASVFFQVMDILQDLRPKWHRLYQVPDAHNLWTPEQRQLADEVGTELQRVAYLSMSGFIDAEYIMDAYARPFAQWRKLRSYIEDYRVQCGEPAKLADGGYQRKHFEQFAAQCEDFLRRSGLAGLTGNERSGTSVTKQSGDMGDKLG